ncbi:hypothetical protein [Halorussus sp. MSC15.2]|uniref:hypothetical protein n=1 Tax=Halorussus sp. MSC15.2 TaxID=2283638 RepID=UPI0013D10DF1|nr:hypothetical protein [Halorussus sp. MSC15.2]NEU58620.1 hypothetical protein [Halorussus sp. MSC15.2]
MRQFTIRHYGTEPHRDVRIVAQNVLRTTQREVETVEVMGIYSLLSEYVDSEAVDVLVEAGATVDDDTLRGDLTATPAVQNAVVALLSDSLLVAEFRDKKGDPVFARVDSDADSVYLDVPEYRRLDDAASPDQLARLFPVSSECDAIRAENGTNPASGTDLTEYAMYGEESNRASAVSSLWSDLLRLNRLPSSVSLCGLTAVLRQTAPDALEALQLAGATQDEIVISGEVTASQDILQALQAAWGDGIHYVRCRDERGDPLVLRDGPRSDYLYLTAAEREQLGAWAAETVRPSNRWQM